MQYQPTSACIHELYSTIHRTKLFKVGSYRYCFRCSVKFSIKLRVFRQSNQSTGQNISPELNVFCGASNSEAMGSRRVSSELVKPSGLLGCHAAETTVSLLEKNERPVGWRTKPASANVWSQCWTLDANIYGTTYVYYVWTWMLFVKISSCKIRNGELFSSTLKSLPKWN